MRHVRERRALELLAAHASGLAPTLLQAAPGAHGPRIVMTWLPGRPLRGVPLDGRQTRALAEAVTELHHCVPAGRLAQVPLRPGRPPELVARIRAWRPGCRCTRPPPWPRHCTPG
ncbi:phosphotransferase [Kitasatospora arboriphila]